MYLQKCLQYQDCKIIYSNENHNLFKDIMTFMIVGLKKSIPFVLKAIPEIKVERKWLSTHFEESIQALHQIGFAARVVVKIIMPPTYLHTVNFLENLEFLQSNLRKANKLTYKVLHPNDNEQSVSLASAIFDATTWAAVKSYFPDPIHASNFLKLKNCWWTAIARQSITLNFRIGNVVTLNDMKPIFLRQLVEWFQLILER